MSTYYIRFSPKWGIISSLHFLLEGYGNQNRECILCFSCNFYDDVTSVTSTHLRNTSYFLSTICGPHVVEVVDVTLDGMQHSSYLLNKPHCSVMPVGAWKWICHAKSIPVHFLKIQVSIFKKETLEAESGPPEQHPHGSDI